MDMEIDLAEPELVAMRPEEHREAVRLLAALLVAARPPLPSEGTIETDRGRVTLAEDLPLARVPNGNAGNSKARGRPR